MRVGRWRWIVLTGMAVGCATPRYPGDPFSMGPTVEPPFATPGSPGTVPDYYSSSPSPNRAPSWPGPETRVPPPAGYPQATPYPNTTDYQPAPPNRFPGPQTNATDINSAGEPSRQPVVPSEYVPSGEAPQPFPPNAGEAPPPHSTEGAYARAPDFRWLRGRLDYVAMDGQWHLRYAPLNVEDDPFGGSLILQHDARLAQFQPGDVVYVEGELVEQQTRMVPDNTVYRIRHIEPLP